MRCSVCNALSTVTKCLSCRASARHEPLRKPWLRSPPPEEPLGSWAVCAAGGCYRVNPLGRYGWKCEDHQ